MQIAFTINKSNSQTKLCVVVVAIGRPFPKLVGILKLRDS